MNQEIKLPPLVGTLAALPTRHKEVIEAYATAAIALDRQQRGDPVGWMPIETAPKDGSTILVWFRQHGAMTVCWGDRDYDHTSEYAIWLVEDHKHGPYPVRGYSKGDDTHWMPLPTAPQPTNPVIKESLTVAEPVKVPSDEMQGLSDRAYCQYIEQMRRAECLGWEQKVKDKRFGETELKAHTKAGEFLGRHRAFSEAGALLSRHGAAQPSASDDYEAGRRSALGFARSVVDEILRNHYHGSGIDGLQDLIEQAAQAITREQNSPTTTTADGQPAPSAEQVGDAIELLSKYRKLCKEVRRGDGFHLQRINNAIVALSASPVAAQPSVPALTDDDLMRVFWKHFRNFASSASAVTYTRWKDGIDIDVMSAPMLAYSRDLLSMSAPTPPADGPKGDPQ